MKRDLQLQMPIDSNIHIANLTQHVKRQNCLKWGCKILISNSYFGNKGAKSRVKKGILEIRVQEMSKYNIKFPKKSLLILIHYLNSIWPQYVL